MGSRRPHRLACLAIFAIVALLWLPAMYYQLDTPSGLVDRNPDMAPGVANRDNFLRNLHFNFAETENLYWFNKFRPFLRVWNGLIWHHFGDGSAHYVNRWLFVFGTAAFLVAAFRRVDKLTPSGTPHQVIAVAIVAGVWLFFPNSAFTLVESVDLYSAFFLSVCNYAAALLLTRRAAPAHALFVLGFLGLLISKETNIALAPWLIVWYLAIVRANGRWSAGLMVAGACGAASIVALWRILLVIEVVTAQGGAYFLPDRPMPARILDNAPTLIEALFQLDTNPAMTAALCLLLLAPLAVAKVAKMRVVSQRELAFIVLLCGEFASLFLALSASNIVVPHYWCVLIPLLASLLAFAAKYLLHAAKQSRELARGTAFGLVAFVGLFVSSNYYSFLYLFINQHSARSVDDAMIGEAVSLIDKGEYVLLDAPGSRHRREQHKTLRRYTAIRYGSDPIHIEPPSDPRKPYYILDMVGRGLPSDVEASATKVLYLAARSDYRVLDYAAKLSGFL